MVGLQQTQKKLEQLRENLEEKHIMTESLEIAAKAGKRGAERQERGPGQVQKRRGTEICVQQYFHGFAWVVYDRVMEYARLENLSCVLKWKGWLGARRVKVRMWRKMERRLQLR